MKIHAESVNLFPTVDEGLRMAFFDYGQLEKINQPTFTGLIMNQNKTGFLYSRLSTLIFFSKQAGYRKQMDLIKNLNMYIRFHAGKLF
ncbi:hypothetical protein SAMN00777080_4399 [Aquiflexum balticum DSM 16537]|uniref:Uncharacterized protein n=1 Tax=Aquiflexum balticum DSM 16537 TaxID=758820 RepID=A0A1W2HAZ1_9BACT|nr:hypothetical protein [Aquiflexum balticum]SMD45736.1 hypothetical protein SAMN00777080_4399 [Aquiflexum balticum DSM 16537]